AEGTGFTYLLPFLEQDNTYRLYHFEVPWFNVANYDAVNTQVKLFFCPSNRGEGSLDLGPIAAEWNITLPPLAASCDYAFCKGANAALHRDWRRGPASVPGVFANRAPREARA